jgi:hypothetical protein
MLVMFCKPLSLVANMTRGRRVRSSTVLKILTIVRYRSSIWGYSFSSTLQGYPGYPPTRFAPARRTLRGQEQRKERDGVLYYDLMSKITYHANRHSQGIINLRQSSYVLWKEFDGVNCLHNLMMHAYLRNLDLLLDGISSNRLCPPPFLLAVNYFSCSLKSLRNKYRS